MIRDRVRGVIEGLHTGCYLWGRGGTSKTYTVLEELRQRQANYILHNSHITPRALAECLAKHHDSIIVLDDCENLLENTHAFGVLKAALWSQHTDTRWSPRLVTWGVHPHAFEFVFTGALVMIGNRPLQDTPDLRAPASRITVLEHAATFAEIAAFMRHLALDGYEYDDDYLMPGECMVVAEFIIQRMRQLGRDLDLRVYKNSLKDHLQHRGGNSVNDWKELVETRLRGTTVIHESRAEVMHREAMIAHEIASMDLSHEEKHALWTERTGKHFAVRDDVFDRTAAFLRWLDRQEGGSSHGGGLDQDACRSC
jgi:hypothetical protein